MTDRARPLTSFSPLVADWFESRFERATSAQELVWPAARRGENLLLTSPTGTGKTLAAFLVAIDSLIRGDWPSGSTAVLYVSPLKALNQDIRVNLEEPLAQLAALAADRGVSLPPVRVETRSGDTDSYRRRRILEKPPEILITTPESLNLLLASPRGRALFASLRCLILDEIHNVAGNRRGTHLVTAVERLVPVAGEFQRIALSATLADPETAALFAAGFNAAGEPRPMTVLRAAPEKRIDISVEMIPPPPETGERERDTPWKRLAAELKPLIAESRSTLVFVNSRRLSEHLALLLNENESEPVAYAHHGSLSREIRSLVEKRLKAGRLRCIVATNSLELGIDIGYLDRIVLVQTPFSISSALQKIGRAGHRVGAVSRARIYCSHGRDLLDALALTEAVRRGVLEDIQPPGGGLDLLVQIILGEALAGEREPDTLFGLIRRSYPYRNLEREDFDAVLEMLAGRFRGAPLPLLTPRIRLGDDGIEPLPAARPLLFMSGGTIPDRGYFTLQSASGAPLGELDEEFVWERKVGDTFAFGSRLWRITALTPRSVEVVPTAAAANATPFYRADPLLRDYRPLEITGELLEQLADAPGRAARFRDLHGFSASAASALDRFLTRIESSIAPVHRRRVVAEYTVSPKIGSALNLLFIHTLWGGRCNAPLALALETELQERGESIGVSWDNDSLLLYSPDPLPRSVLTALGRDSLPRLITAALTRSGIFGARFREAAGRALLLPRAGYNSRTPLWLTRLKAKRLLSGLADRPDFPIVREALRESLEEQFDLPRLFRLLEELESGNIEYLECETETPSPLCEGPLWEQINLQVYSDDRPEGAVAASEEWAVRIASGELLRPRLPRALMNEFLERLGRTATGYRPETAAELDDLLLARVAMRADTITTLRRELYDGAETTAARPLPGREELLVHASLLGRLTSAAADPDDAPDSGRDGLKELFAAWLYYTGPLPAGTIPPDSPFPDSLFPVLLEALEEEDELVRDLLTDDADGEQLMHRGAYERALGWIRARHRAGGDVSISPRELVNVTVQWQGVGSDLETGEALALFEGLPLAAELWEKAVLPLRCSDYRETELDELLRERNIVWRGSSGRRISFHAADFLPTSAPRTADSAPLLPPRGAFTLREIGERNGLRPSEAVSRVWEEVWEGRISADAFAPVRQGIARRFRRQESPPPRPAGRRGLARSRYSPPLGGNWFSLPDNGGGDALERLEEAKEAVRILFGRYPVLFREQLVREEYPFRWQDVFPALRLMEFSGEVVGGGYIETAPGIQFILTAEIERLREYLRRGAPPRPIHISDPASPAGVALDFYRERYPARRGDRWLVIEAGEPLLSYAVSSGSVALENPARFGEGLESLCGLLELPRPPFRRLRIAAVNGESALDLPWAEMLQKAGFTPGLKGFTLWR